MVLNKSQICEICGKHAEVEPLGCKHYPSEFDLMPKVAENKVLLIDRFLRWFD